MITNLDFDNEELVFTFNGQNTLIDFDTIRNSSAWTDSHIINLTLIDGGFTAIPNGFLDNLAISNRDNRKNPADYDQAALIYKLYRFLDGQTLADIEAEIANVEAQRVLLEAEEQTVEDARVAVITSYVNDQTNNDLIEDHYLVKASVEQKIAYANNVSALYANNQGFQYVSYDAEDPVMPFVEVLSGIFNNILAKSQELAPIKVRYNDIKSITAKLINTGDYNDNLETQQRVADLQAESNTLNAQMVAIQGDIDDLEDDKAAAEQDAYAALQTYTAALTVQLNDLVAAEADLPTYVELPTVPEVPNTSFDVATQMRKLYYICSVAQEGWSNPTLATVSVSDIASYENDYGEIILP